MPPERKPLRGITWDHPRGRAPLEASVPQWREMTGQEVIWEARSLKDFGDAPLSYLAPDYDLLLIDHPHIGEAAASGLLHPLDGFLTSSERSAMERDPAGPSLASYWFQNSLWALPVDAACQVSAHRPDLWPEGWSLPSTWEEASLLAQYLRSEGLWMAMALCPTDVLCCFLTLCAQSGDPFVESPPSPPSETTMSAVLGQLLALSRLSHPESLSWNPIQLYDAMSQRGDVVYSPLAFGYSNYSRPGFSTHRLSFGRIPGDHHALLGGVGAAVSAFTDKPFQAARYLIWLCGSSFQSTSYTTSGGQPGHGAAWKDPAADMATGGFLSAVSPVLTHSYTRPRTPGWPEFQEFLGRTVHSWLQHPGSPGQVLEAIVEAHRSYHARP